MRIPLLPAHAAVPTARPKYSDNKAQWRESVQMTGGRNTALASHSGWPPPPDLDYDGFQSPAAGPASGRVSPESHDAIATISAWS